MVDEMDENSLYVAGMAAMKAEKFEKAAEYFSKLVEVSRSRTARLLYATALYESGKVGEAMKFDEFRSAYMRFTQK